MKHSSVNLVVLAAAFALGCNDEAAPPPYVASAIGSAGHAEQVPGPTHLGGSSSVVAGAPADVAGQGGAAAGAAGSGGAPIPCVVDPVAPEQDLGAGKDPLMGMFDLTAALDGLPPGNAALTATITTTLGVITCELNPDVAPIGVANFVGLARGRRPFLDPTSKHWVTRRFYDGLTFHRVVPGFVIQGGDPLGTGVGGPGYSFGNEIGGLSHVAGALAYANTGQPNSNGSQYYVTAAAQPSLDGDYTIFGVCTPLSVVNTIANVPADKNGKPTTPVLMNTVVISRCAE